jgi:hypothetical protein
MAIDFPGTPTLGDQYTYNGQTYVWSGSFWRLVRTSAVGPTGPTGPTGPASECCSVLQDRLVRQGAASVLSRVQQGSTGTDRSQQAPLPSHRGLHTLRLGQPRLRTRLLGNGTLTGRYVAMGPTVVGEIRLNFGSTTTRGSGTYRFSLPTLGVAENYQPMGQVVLRDEGPGITYFGTSLFQQQPGRPHGDVAALTDCYI